MEVIFSSLVEIQKPSETVTKVRAFLVVVHGILIKNWPLFSMANQIQKFRISIKKIHGNEIM